MVACTFLTLSVVASDTVAPQAVSSNHAGPATGLSPTSGQFVIADASQITAADTETVAGVVAAEPLQASPAAVEQAVVAPPMLSDNGKGDLPQVPQAAAPSANEAIPEALIASESIPEAMPIVAPAKQKVAQVPPAETAQAMPQIAPDAAAANVIASAFLRLRQIADEVETLTQENGRLRESYEDALARSALFEAQGKALAHSKAELEVKIAALEKDQQEIELKQKVLEQICDGQQQKNTEQLAQLNALTASYQSLTEQNELLETQYMAVATELSLLIIPPPCPWGVLASGVTGKAKSQLEAICAETPEEPLFPDEARRRTRAGKQIEQPLRETPLAPDDPGLAQALTDVAHSLQRARQFEDAESLFLWAVMIMQGEGNKNHQITGAALNNLGGLYLEMGAHRKAENAFQRALSEYGHVFDDDHPKIAALLNKLASSLRGQGRLPEAEQGFLRSITSYESAMGKNHPHVVAPLHNLALVYLDMKRFEDASRLLDLATSIARAHDTANPYLGYLADSARRLEDARADDKHATNKRVADQTSGFRQ